MDNHPIPQDVTGFQFKLIGNMTVKQFAYLATGVILAWIFLQLPIMVLIKIPISSFFALFGLGLAFVPISGRPMDLMIKNFIKALFRPTQFVYHKSGAPLYSSNTSNFIAVNNNKPTPQLKTISPQLPMPTPPPNQTSNSTQQPSPPPLIVTYPKKGAIEGVQRPTYGKDAKLFIKPISMPGTILTPPDSPNVITGATKDPRGNTLSNILIEVRDKEGNPIRAFKTNELGRFASATPLFNGTYTIHCEDPKAQHKFEIKTLEVTGQIIQPIEIASLDLREELRRELFKTN